MLSPGQRFLRCLPPLWALSSGAGRRHPYPKADGRPKACNHHGHGKGVLPNSWERKLLPSAALLSDPSAVQGKLCPERHIKALRMPADNNPAERSLAIWLSSAAAPARSRAPQGCGAPKV